MAYPTYFPYQSTQNYFQPQAQSFPQQMQQMPQAPQMGQNGYACRPVTSREEALGVQVDFFGPGAIMPDLSHGVIYLKRFNQQTGGCDLFVFTAEQPKQEEPVRYATLEDLEKLREELTRKAAANDAE